MKDDLAYAYSSFENVVQRVDRFEIPKNINDINAWKTLLDKAKSMNDYLAIGWYTQHLEKAQKRQINYYEE